MDVAIVEVGIGGAHDCTNVIKNPVVSGIAMLGIEHTSSLGNTIQQIAWHKTGIMKVRNSLFYPVKFDKRLLNLFLPSQANLANYQNYRTCAFDWNYAN